MFFLCLLLSQSRKYSGLRGSQGHIIALFPFFLLLLFLYFSSFIYFIYFFHFSFRRLFTSSDMLAAAPVRSEQRKNGHETLAATKVNSHDRKLCAYQL
jgi:hypothetical protein